jgi:hypothetical protein
MLSLLWEQPMPYYLGNSFTQTQAHQAISPSSHSTNKNQTLPTSTWTTSFAISLKQAVYIPSNFVSLGTQLQLFAAASNIFFGNGSVCTNRLKHLLYLVRQNKKSFCDKIALTVFLPQGSLLQSTVNKRVQRWLPMCKQATIARTQVNNNTLNFDNLLEEVLNESFNIRNFQEDCQYQPS